MAKYVISEGSRRYGAGERDVWASRTLARRSAAWRQTVRRPDGRRRHAATAYLTVILRCADGREGMGDQRDAGEVTWTVEGYCGAPLHKR